MCYPTLTCSAVLCHAVSVRRTGCYAGHSGSIMQLLVLGEQLLSLGKDGQLLVWKIGEYDTPQVSTYCAQLQPCCYACIMFTRARLSSGACSPGLLLAVDCACHFCI